MSFGLGYSFIIVFVTAAIFRTLMFSMPKLISVPAKVVKSNKTDVYFNMIASLVHSLISSVACIYSFYVDPNLASRIDGSFSQAALLASCFSLGYFVHDFIYFAKDHSLFSNGGIVIHHIVVIFCFGLAVVFKRFVNYVVVALICEINSVFLHTRQLLHMAGYSRSSYFYRLNSLINIFTYVIFRICTLSWMIRWLVLQRGIIPDSFNTIGLVGMTVMTIVNIVLFARLLSKDYWPRVSRAGSLDTSKAKQFED